MTKLLWSVLWLIFLIAIVNGQTNIANSQTVKAVTLCSIKANPNLYIGKQFDIEAIYVAGFEMGWLEDPNSCNSNENKRFAIQYKFDETYKEKTDAKVLRQMNKILRRKQMPRKVKGRFTIVVSEYKKKNEDDTRYEYEITVLEVLSATRVRD